MGVLAVLTLVPGQRGRKSASISVRLVTPPGNVYEDATDATATSQVGDGEGTTKKLCDKDFAERSGELSGAIRLKTLVLLGNDR